MEERKKEMERKIAIIKEFAEKMGYTTAMSNYKFAGRRIKSIELVETEDSELNPFCWAWYTDTYEEVK